MKTTFLTAVLLGTLAFNASAATTGPVDLNNLEGGAIYVVNTSVLAPEGTFVQVFVNSTLLSVDSVDTFTTLSDGLDGRFFGGTVATGLANGSSQQFTIYAWTGAATYELAQTTVGAYYGSVTYTQTLGTDVGSPPPLPPSLSNPNLIMVAAVPEPTTIVLGAMGGLALLARRRKA
jgi:hypothetical protein